MWVRLDDGFYDHPKARAVGKDGRELYIAGLCRVAATLSDGFIPDADLQLVAAKAEVKPRPTVARLVEARLWERVEGGWLVHDYHDWNPTADEQIEKRRKRAEAGRKGGLKSRPPGRNGQAPSEANASANAPPDTNHHAKSEPEQTASEREPRSRSLLAIASSSVSSTDCGLLDDDADLVLRLVTATAAILGGRDHERRMAAPRSDLEPVHDPEAHRQACIERRCGSHELAEAALEHRDLDPAQLADLLDPPAPALTLVPPPLPEYDPGPVPERASAEVVAQALAAARRSRT